MGFRKSIKKIGSSIKSAAKSVGQVAKAAAPAIIGGALSIATANPAPFMAGVGMMGAGRQAQPQPPVEPWDDSAFAYQPPFYQSVMQPSYAMARPTYAAPRPPMPMQQLPWTAYQPEPWHPPSPMQATQHNPFAQLFAMLRTFA